MRQGELIILTATANLVKRARRRDNRTMLRDKNLIPLSHQHQHALALCVRIDRAIQAGQVDMLSWQTEIQQIFIGEVRAHFEAEERELFPVALHVAELGPLVDELLSE